METNTQSSKKIVYILGVVLLFFVVIALLAVGYYYINSRGEVDDTQTDSDFGVPIFDPTANYQVVGAVLKDRIAKAKKIDTSKLKEIDSILPNTEQGIFHRGELDIRYGGVVKNVSYNPSVLGESIALSLTVNSINDPNLTYSVNLTKNEIDKLNVFLNIPYEAPQVTSPRSIEVGDLINVIQLIDLLESGRENIVSIQIEKTR